MKRWVSKLLVIALLITLVPADFFVVPDAKAELQFVNGDGTRNNPYQIASCEQLQSIKNSDNNTYGGEYFVLIQNIDCSATNPNDPSFVVGGIWGNQTGFNPIGYNANDVSVDFAGNFDGQGYTISNVYINKTTEDFVGIFGQVSGSFKNVTVTGADIRGGANYTAGFVAYLDKSSNGLNNISVVDSVIEGQSYVGSVVGAIVNNQGTESSPIVTKVSVENSTVNGLQAVGGIVGGVLGNVTIENSYFNGNILSLNNITASSFGGIVGEAAQFNDAGPTLKIRKTYAVGLLQNSPLAEGNIQFAGGLVGYLLNEDSVIEDSVANMLISDSNSNRGVVVGLLTGQVVAADFLTSVYYDATVNPTLECANGGVNNDLECKSYQAVYDVGDITEVYNSTAYEPFTSWDFDDTWRVTDTYPELIPPTFIRIISQVSTPTNVVRPSIQLSFPYSGTVAFGEGSSCTTELPVVDEGVQNFEFSYAADGAQDFPNGTYGNCSLQVFGIEQTSELLYIPPFTVNTAPLGVRLLPEEDTVTAENVVGFQLNFNRDITTTPTPEDFTVVNGVVNDVVSFNNNNQNYWVLVIPSGDDVDVELTFEAGAVEDFLGNPNPEVGPVQISYLNTEFSGSGAGTEESPYLISSCVQLQEMQKDLDAYYQLTRDIDCLESAEWNINPTEFDEEDDLIPDDLDDVTNNGYRGFNPVGNNLSPFIGTLDGNGHQIENLWIFRKYNNYVGLFGFAENAYVYDLEIVNSNIIGGESTGTIFGFGSDIEINNVDVSGSTARAYRNFNGGGLVGTLTSNQNSSLIRHSSYAGSVHGTGNVIGGIVGRMSGGSSIYFTEANVEVDGGYAIGGLVGEMNGGQIFFSESTGTLTLERDDVYGKPGTNAGGFVGVASGDSLIIGSSADVNLQIVGEDIAATQSRMGGFVGSIGDNVNIAYSSAHGDVNGDTEQVGGFVGYSSSANGIERSYATGNVTGVTEVGGFAGNISGSLVQDVYATGNVTGTGQSIGGLIGYAGLSDIDNAYSSGTVTGPESVGGLVGTMFGGSLEHTFSVSSVVSGGDFVGALMGDVDTEDTTLSYNYYVPIESGVNNCYPGGNIANHCIGLDGEISYFYSEGNLPFGLMGENVWNDPESQRLIWDFEPDALPVLFPALPELETLDVTFNGNESVTLRGELISGNRNELAFFYLADTEEVYFNSVDDFGGIPIGPILGQDLESDIFELTVELVASDPGENQLLCGETYYYLSLAAFGFGDPFFGVSENIKSFTTPACSVEPEPTPSRGGGGSGSRASNKVSFEDFMTYEQEVQKVMAEKIVTENPEGITNKCEALTMMSRVFEWKVPVAASSKYTDVPAWCTNVAAYGTERGIVEGRTATTLGMETPVTRDEIAVMLYRELKMQNYKFGDFSNVRFAGFSDALTPWAEEAVMALYKEGIIKGFANGDSPQTVFGGSRNILKQDFGVMLIRIK